MTDNFNGWDKSDAVPDNEKAQSYSEMFEEKQKNIHAADGTTYPNGREKEIGEQIAEKTKTETVKVQQDARLKAVQAAQLKKLDRNDREQDIAARIIKQG